MPLNRVGCPVVGSTSFFSCGFEKNYRDKSASECSSAYQSGAPQCTIRIPLSYDIPSQRFDDGQAISVPPDLSLRLGPRGLSVFD